MAVKKDCPECKNSDKLRKIKNEEFYRCSGCSNEWFDFELIESEYKMLRFFNDDGKEVFVAMTPEKVAEWKEKGIGCYRTKGKFHNKRGTNGRFTKKDKNLLRRLRKK